GKKTDMDFDGFGAGAHKVGGANENFKVAFEVYTTTPAKAKLDKYKAGTSIGDVRVPADNMTVTVLFTYNDSISATQISVLSTGKKNGLRYEFKFDKNAQKYMEENGYTLVEYGVIFSSAANKANATISWNGEAYVTPASNITKTAIVQNGKWAQGAKVVSSNETETIFAGTVVNWTAAHYNQEAYICAYSIYRDANGVETISYISYGDEEGQSAEYATSSLSKMMNYFIANDVFAGRTVSEGAVWNTLLFGAETLGEDKVLAVDANTVAILVDGVVVVRTLDGTAVSAEAKAAATAAVEEFDVTVENTVALTVA
ncbi:MAG: hypothetical protein IKT56_04830, partial [Clostridia bacterium]|nr:hypothetical protein [Clostridia bacterium]